MSSRPTYPRRRINSRLGAAESSNPGTCNVCGVQSAWRSVGGRCWRCEMDQTKKRTPMFIERDVLSTAPSKKDE